MCFQPFLPSERKSNAGRRKEKERGSAQVGQECTSIPSELRVKTRFIAKMEMLIWFRWEPENY